MGHNDSSLFIWIVLGEGACRFKHLGGLGTREDVVASPDLTTLERAIDNIFRTSTWPIG